MTDRMNSASALLSAPSSRPGPVVDEDVFDDSSFDGCSICLEPFTSLDPPSVTKCKHEYHLHCILEWSQRRIECPVCLQHLVLKDPVSQDLLAAVEGEKILNSMRSFNHTNQGNENSPHVDESDNEHPIMRHIAAIGSRARNITRRRWEMTASVDPSQIRPSVNQVNSSSREHQNIAFGFSDTDTSGSARETSRSPSDILAFSESLKSKISTVSIRYKESISKNTHSLKEKLIAHNESVKELSRGVHREMSTGISGIARLISQKRAEISVRVGTSKETSKEIAADSTALFRNSNSGGSGGSLSKEKSGW